MTFDAFDDLAGALWERIPAEYRAGVDGMVVERRALPHPELADVYTLGECVTESFPSEWGGPDTTRSTIILYYGSFFRLSRLDAEFAWEDELWETLTHELQHHLESLATDDTLVDMDYAADENFRRGAGEPFDPWFFRAGILEDGWYRVEDEYFLETAAASPLHFTWQGADFEVDLPAVDGDVVLVALNGLPSDVPPLNLAVVRPRGWLGALRALVRSSRPRVQELAADARKI